MSLLYIHERNQMIANNAVDRKQDSTKVIHETTLQRWLRCLKCNNFFVISLNIRNVETCDLYCFIFLSLLIVVAFQKIDFIYSASQQKRKPINQVNFSENWSDLSEKVYIVTKFSLSSFFWHQLQDVLAMHDQAWTISNDDVRIDLRRIGI